MHAWSSGGEDAAVCRSAVKLMLRMLKEWQFRCKASDSWPGEARLEEGSVLLCVEDCAL